MSEFDLLRLICKGRYQTRRLMRTYSVMWLEAELRLAHGDR